MRSHALSLLLYNILTLPTTCEIRSFQGPLDAASNYIHYSEGFIVAPGYVDISALTFSTNDAAYEGKYREPDASTGTAGENKAKDESGAEEKDEKETTDDAADDDADAENGDDDKKDGDGGGGRSLKEMDQIVDIVLFREPHNCSNSKAGCDWTELGIGASSSAGELRWCCWEDAVDLGLCQGGPEEWGRLIMNRTRYEGHYRSISVSETGHQEAKVKYGKLDEEKYSGKFILVMANCNPTGRNLTVSGKYVWHSKHGYLPGDLFGAMYFYMALTLAYGILFGWYAISMRIYKESTIPIQSWILLTIGIGLMEVFFKGGDYWVWNEDGTRFWFAMYTGVILGVMKRAISRCLVVMVSLGWGVVRDTLSQMRRIIILGSIYALCSAASDVFEIFAIVENETLSINEEEEIFDVVTILTFAVAAIDVTFYMWILDALSGTMQYLENLNQNMKLKRYLRLRFILLLSILFAVVWAVFGIVNNYMETSILEQEQEWAVQAAWEINYVMVMAAVAILWRPNATAKEYAFVMELPSMGHDVDYDEGIEMPETNADVIGGDEDKNADSGKTLKIDDAVDA
jgi:hypothetical protein